MAWLRTDLADLRMRSIYYYFCRKRSISSQLAALQAGLGDLTVLQRVRIQCSSSAAPTDIQLVEQAMVDIDRRLPRSADRSATCPPLAYSLLPDEGMSRTHRSFCPSRSDLFELRSPDGRNVPWISRYCITRFRTTATWTVPIVARTSNQLAYPCETRFSSLRLAAYEPLARVPSALGQPEFGGASSAGDESGAGA